MSILGIIIIVWLVCSLVDYLVVQRIFRIRKLSWDHSDALTAAYVSLVTGPIGLLVSILLLCSESLSEWLDKPSRW